MTKRRVEGGLHGKSTPENFTQSDRFFKIQNHGKTDLSIEANLLEQIY